MNKIPFQHHEGPYTVTIEETGKGEVCAFIKEGDVTESVEDDDGPLTLASVYYVGSNPSHTAALFATAPEFFDITTLLLTGEPADIPVAIELARKAMAKYHAEAAK